MMKPYILANILFSSLIYATAYAADEFTRETIPTSEAADTAEIVRLAVANVRRDQKLVEDGIARRDAHAKAHGCVQARFTVTENLRNNLKVGIFSAPNTFDAVVRFSNGNPRVQDDHEGDGRGMAIKIYDTDREQDFLMINHPVFFVKSSDDYVKFNQAASRGTLLSMAKYFLAGFHFYEFAIVLKIQAKKIVSVLNETYFSMTPYKLGSQAVKYSARPCQFLPRSNLTNSSNYLREGMAKFLKSSAACFEFGVQVRNNLATQPLEDSTVEWSQKESPFIPVALVQIPPQKFDSPEQMSACENMSYNPWHTREEHRPLGNMNRIRKTVYEAVSKTRHELNGARN